MQCYLRNSHCISLKSKLGCVGENGIDCLEAGVAVAGVAERRRSWQALLDTASVDCGQLSLEFGLRISRIQVGYKP